MQHIMAVHVPVLTLTSMPSAYLFCQATAVVKTLPISFPTHQTWSYFIGTIDQYMYDGKESKKHVRISNSVGEDLTDDDSSSNLPLRLILTKVTYREF